MQTLNANEYIARGFDIIRPVMAAFVCRELQKKDKTKGLTDEALSYNNRVAMWGQSQGRKKRQPVQGELGM
jgi:hypothetical protein